MTIRIKNWSKHQHFKDRTPPWIKLYRDILDDPDWHDLDGETVKILIGLWLVASEDETHDGRLPGARKLAFRLRISISELAKAINRLSHWLEQDDIGMSSERHRNDAPETETETETEKNTPLPPKGGGEPVAPVLRPKKRRTRGEIIRGYSDEVREIVNGLWDIWPQADPKDGRTIQVDGARFGQRVSEILRDHPEIDSATLMEAGKTYLASKRDRYQAPQWFFGVGREGAEAAWVGCVRLVLTKREREARHAS